MFQAIRRINEFSKALDIITGSHRRLYNRSLVVFSTKIW
ncbi:Protein CBG27521 [Caenorhabditis briggsae]|uniref:Protein CBG27521 n=1 Tax=Caenorhabditis briggsae TaxID=6238 RepID=B6IKI2_CAEBR|nr:Protein CBG27521 [Caenorhabditis briggsae]CAS00412.1 Protein CBG27521 [Caenorhabditis briggsae]